MGTRKLEVSLDVVIDMLKPQDEGMGRVITVEDPLPEDTRVLAYGTSFRAIEVILASDAWDGHWMEHPPLTSPALRVHWRPVPDWPERVG